MFDRTQLLDTISGQRKGIVAALLRVARFIMLSNVDLSMVSWPEINLPSKQRVVRLPRKENAMLRLVVARCGSRSFLNWKQEFSRTSTNVFREYPAVSAGKNNDRKIEVRVFQ